MHFSVYTALQPETTPAAIFSFLDMRGTSGNFRERTQILQKIDSNGGINMCSKRRWKLNFKNRSDQFKWYKQQHSNVSAIRNNIVPRLTKIIHYFSLTTDAGVIKVVNIQDFSYVEILKISLPFLKFVMD